MVAFKLPQAFLHDAKFIIKNDPANTSPAKSIDSVLDLFMVVVPLLPVMTMRILKLSVTRFLSIQT